MAALPRIRKVCTEPTLKRLLCSLVLRGARNILDLRIHEIIEIAVCVRRLVALLVQFSGQRTPDRAQNAAIPAVPLGEAKTRSADCVAHVIKAVWAHPCPTRPLRGRPIPCFAPCDLRECSWLFDVPVAAPRACSAGAATTTPRSPFIGKARAVQVGRWRQATELSQSWVQEG